MILKLIALIFLIHCSYSAELPTNYEYYTSGGIKTGLIAEGNYFKLNGKEIRILSGSFHYFRVHQHKWRETLLKFKAAGLNAVQLYSPWNLHEEIPGHFDFETGMLNLTDFLHAIKEADMFAMYRPGPYICAEWENGGLPAWLLRDPNMKLRSNYTPYLNAVEKYYEKLLSVIHDYQFTVKGGPIIAMQIENEFGGYGDSVSQKSDHDYLAFIKNISDKNGFKELYFSSDPPDKAATKHGSLPDILSTANFNENPVQHLTLLAEKQKRPLYVAEYWSGWFTHWGDAHMDRRNPLNKFGPLYEDILLKMNSSVNIYMFIGGTNFGFMNGANGVKANGHSATTITSYDYDAPLTEAGDYTDKYWKTKELIEKLHKERPHLPKVKIPEPPKLIPKANYGVVNVTQYLTLNDLLSKIKPIASDHPKPMEMLDIGTNYGQNWGFVLYRTKTPKINNLVLKGGVKDRAVILIDNKEVNTVEVVNKDSNFNLTSEHFSATGNEHILDILVENLGRTNYGHELNSQRKGLNGDVLTDSKVHNNWQIYPLEFKQKFIEGLKTDKWKPFENLKNPAIYSAVLDIKDTPKDTFLKLEKWTKTVVFVNGFNVGRLWNIGPTKTLYIPAPLLKTGKNQIYLFELHSAANTIEFTDKPILG